MPVADCVAIKTPVAADNAYAARSLPAGDACPPSLRGPDDQGLSLR